MSMEICLNASYSRGYQSRKNRGFNSRGNRPPPHCQFCLAIGHIARYCPEVPKSTNPPTTIWGETRKTRSFFFHVHLCVYNLMMKVLSFFHIKNNFRVFLFKVIYFTLLYFHLLEKQNLSRSLGSITSDFPYCFYGR